MLRVSPWQAKYNNYRSYSYKLLYYYNFFWDWQFYKYKVRTLNKDTTPYISPLTFKIVETFNIDSQVNWDREQVHSTCSSQNTDDMRQEAGAEIRLRKGYKCEEDLQQQVWMYTPPLPIVNWSNTSSMVVEDVVKMSIVH